MLTTVLTYCYEFGKTRASGSLVSKHPGISRPLFSWHSGTELEAGFSSLGLEWLKLNRGGSDWSTLYVVFSVLLLCVVDSVLLCTLLLFFDVWGLFRPVDWWLGTESLCKHGCQLFVKPFLYEVWLDNNWTDGSADKSHRGQGHCHYTLSFSPSQLWAPQSGFVSDFVSAACWLNFHLFHKATIKCDISSE